MKEVKPGWKSTEFWITIIVIAFSSVHESGLLAGTSVAGVVATAYSISRGIAKKG